ncbi:MAG: diphosphomevalonate decarboxylase [Woeseiaceae bacterium]|jgi:diphosphomevalonate decarboxylase|nr:diphosphomevalonate decarboxylase [Woeseiaceae bacterium]
MQRTARAQPNIALIKYWGKRDSGLNLPAVGSISITLDTLYTEMSIELDPTLEADVLRVNDEPAPGMLPRVSACIDSVLGASRERARIDSHGNFPVAAGLASSASAFAACVVAADGLDATQRSRATLANLAGRASGSAARSLFGGFVELANREDSVHVESLLDAGEWPLEVVVAITSEHEKAVGSGEAMEISRRSSPFYGRWLAEQDADLDTARQAIAARDVDALGAIAEHNCLKMHSVMWTSRPPLVYWTAATIACMETVRRLRDAGTPVFFTIDAGPQVKAVCEPSAAGEVEAALAATPGVLRTLRTPLGEGARLVDPA